MIIGIDCDEVLAETLDTAFKTSDLLKKYHTKREEIISYNPLQDINNTILLQDAIEIFFGLFAADEYRTIQPVSGAREKLQQRKNAGHTLIVITGRPLRLKERTVDWVNQHFPNLFSDFLFSGAYTDQEIDKSELCKQKGIQLVVEDNLFFVADLSKHSVPCFLIDRPRNQDYTPETYPGVIKVHTRDEISL